jgi:hypothetical protein
MILGKPESFREFFRQGAATPFNSITKGGSHEGMARRHESVGVSENSFGGAGRQRQRTHAAKIRRRRR